MLVFCFLIFCLFLFVFAPSCLKNFGARVQSISPSMKRTSPSQKTDNKEKKEEKKTKIIIIT